MCFLIAECLCQARNDGNVEIQELSLTQCVYDLSKRAIRTIVSIIAIHRKIARAAKFIRL